jgi:hypothetical protein
MSYPADRRRNSGRKNVTQRPRISLAQTSYLRGRSQRSAREKPALFFRAKFPRGRFGARREVAPKIIYRVKSFVVAWLVPGKSAEES